MFSTFVDRGSAVRVNISSRCAPSFNQALLKIEVITQILD